MLLGECRLTSREVEAEIRQAHAIITDVIGQAPKGYTAPGWSNDERVKPWLRALDYEYDCSSFPAWPMLAIPALLLLFSAPEARKSIRLVRSDWRNVVFGSTYTRLATEGDGKGMALSPVPLALLRLPIWHSVALALPWHASRLLLRTSMRNRSADYFYVVHPMDFFDPAQDASAEGLEAWRSSISLAKRMDIWNRVTAYFADCDVIPMREIMDMLRHQQTSGKEAA